MEKSDARKLPLEALNERRRRAVKLRQKGKTWQEVAQEAELSINSARTAHAAWEAGGRKAVNVKKRGRKPGSGRRLTREQEKRIQRLICDKAPDQLKLGFALCVNADGGCPLFTDSRCPVFNGFLLG